MKTLEWRRFFEEQREQQSKVIFSVTELANVARRSPRVLNVELDRLVKRGVICRYARGKYGAPGAAGPADLLPFLDSSAYITGLFALHLHNLITQVPLEITCFTNRRHNRSRRRVTPVGQFVFVCVNAGIYAHPGEGIIASPEQSLCDFLHLAARRSLKAESLVTFMDLRRLSRRTFERILVRYPKTVSKAVQELVGVPPRALPA